MDLLNNDTLCFGCAEVRLVQLSSEVARLRQYSTHLASKNTTINGHFQWQTVCLPEGR